MTTVLIIFHKKRARLIIARHKRRINHVLRSTYLARNLLLTAYSTATASQI